MEGRLWIVFDAQLNCLSHIRAEDFRSDDQAKVDAGRYTTARNPIAIDDHTFLNRLRAKERQQVERQPMCGGSITAQQTRRAEEQRAPVHTEVT